MAVKTWVSPISDNWSVASRWTPTAPLTGDQVFIGNTTQSAAFVVTEDVNLTISSLTMAGNHKGGLGTTLTVTQPAVLTVSSSISIDGDSKINGNGVLVSNGAISGLGTIIASNNGVLDITGTGSVANGVVLDFDVSTTLGSTLKLDLSGGVTSAANIRMNNANQVLDIGPSTTLTIGALETVAHGTLQMSGGTVADTFGIVVGGQGAPGTISGFGTIAADLTGGGQKGQIDTVTASGGTLTLTGGFVAGTATFVAAIDSTAGSTLKFDGTASVAQPIVINNAFQTLEIGAAGALTITGMEVVTNGTVKMDGGSLSDTSSFVVDTAATLTGKGIVTAGTALSGDGIVKASGGTLELVSDLTASNTSFDVDSVGGSVLKIDGAVGSLTKLGFLGSSGVIELADVAGGTLQGFSGTIAGLTVSANASVPTNEVNIQAAATKAVLSGSTVTVFNGSTAIGTLALSAAPVQGTYAVVKTDATLGGTDVFLSNQPPGAPSTPVLAPASDSGTKGDSVTNVTTPQITGHGVAGDTVNLFLGGAPIASATVDSGGNWAITATSLAEGVNVLTATQTDLAGNTSVVSAALNLTLDTTAPTAPSITQGTETSISGVAEAASTIALFDGVTQVGTGSTNGTGHWSVPNTLTAGSHTLTASATDRAGNVSASSASVTAVIGTAGNDVLSAGPGFSIVLGEAGDDTFKASIGDGNAAYDGGAGTDTYDLSATTADASVNLLTGVASSLQTGTDKLTAIENVIGGSGNDTIVANGANNVLQGGAGNDTYVVVAATDVVIENAGQGRDFVLAKSDYTLAAGTEVEVLESNTTAGVTLTGNAFSHVIDGGVGNDTLNGGAGNDTLNGGAGADVMSGGGGNDTFLATVGDGNDSYDGGLGSDTYSLAATTAGATVNLGLGTSTSADTGTDTLTSVENVIGSSGADTFVASVGDGNNSYNGGAGTDTYDLSATTADANVNLVNGVASSLQTGTDRLTSIENVIGGSGNDTIVAKGANSVLQGGAGNDTYVVAAPTDVVIENVGQGHDIVLAKSDYTLAAGAEIETLKSGTTAGVTLTGNAFSHTIIGGTGNDTLIGGDGNDALNGGAGADVMAGGGGNDTYIVDNTADVVNESLGAGTDTILASVNYSLSAGSSIEFLKASVGTGLSLTGNEFNNTIVGGAGADILNGGSGNDVLTGGAGNDLFKFLSGFGSDIITDFTAGPVGNQDLIDISGLGITAATFGSSVSITGGANTLITIGADTIHLIGVAPSNINSSDFVLA